jgi:hypothetical protein
MFEMFRNAQEIYEQIHVSTAQAKNTWLITIMTWIMLFYKSKFHTVFFFL